MATASKGTQSLSFTYDVDGLRKTKTVNGEVHTYYYAGGKLVRETYGDTVLDFFYDQNGHPFMMRQNMNVYYYYITNAQGDVIRMTDEYGQTAARYQYDPYGDTIDASGSHANINPLRYRGYYYDSETELYYLQSRYYDPEIGRFLNADVYVATGQGFIGNNMYAYCLNNPVNSIDSDGKMTDALLWWTSTMWWLCGIDFALPVGDAVYLSVAISIGAVALVVELFDTDTQSYIEESNANKAGEGEVTSGNPPTEKDGYKAPKGGPKKGKTKDGKTGWVDKYGNIWVPAPTGSSNAHGGGHWDVQRADGNGYINVYPGGTTRPGSGKPPILPPIKPFKSNVLLPF